jgi:hypothetical protein
MARLSCEISMILISILSPLGVYTKQAIELLYNFMNFCDLSV